MSMLLDKKSIQGPLLVLQLIILVLLVVALTFHVKSVRVFRWEQSVSGGLLVTYSVAVLGLALHVGMGLEGLNAFQIYICSSGALWLGINAGVIYHRWKRAGNLTRVVAELLGALGIPVRRQIHIKVCLCAAASVLFFVDMVLTVLLMM